VPVNKIMGGLMLIVHLIVIALFVILGIVFLQGKGAFLIAGYNTSSNAEKAKYDEKALCKFMGYSMFRLGACWVVAAGHVFTNHFSFLFIGFGMFIVNIIITIIYANTGNRFRK
jgi:preprotein translocase subunit SecG